MNELLTTRSKSQWARIGTERRSGILAPLFSVRSKESVGIGDLADLRLLVDWCAKTSNSILQLLPMNEVGSTSCPYDAVSSFALEPSYLALKALPGASKAPFAKALAELAAAFPAGRNVDYRIKGAKMEFLWKLFSAQGAKRPKPFTQFRARNAYWLDDYALYKALKFEHAGKAWYEWPEDLRDRDIGALEIFAASHGKELEYHAWVQWQLGEQFADAKTYAASKGILLKGDLPILISRDSADVWAHRAYFKLESAAGAPPDMYCAKGQRWGMPTYNWDAIAEDRYRYPKEKLVYAENFYDILRIDHVVGLFRIWSIPYNEPPENEGLNGAFDPRDENVWEEHGNRLLGMMSGSTSMLLCAEDLGMIPKACPKTLERFGMPGNEVQRWVKDWAKRHDFLPPDMYRPTAVAMLSTHDTTNWPAWWESEAGTVDEALFVRKCVDRGIDFRAVASGLFDPARSRHGRLRWREDVASKGAFIAILGKPEAELADFIDLYVNSYGEKEKLWARLGLAGAMREKCDRPLVKAVFTFTLRASSVFAINLIVDWLMLGDIYFGDPYDYRINTPGTVSPANWSLVIPRSLDDLLKDPMAKTMKALVAASGRG